MARDRLICMALRQRLETRASHISCFGQCICIQIRAHTLLYSKTCMTRYSTPGGRDTGRDPLLQWFQSLWYICLRRHPYTINYYAGIGFRTLFLERSLVNIGWRRWCPSQVQTLQLWPLPRLIGQSNQVFHHWFYPNWYNNDDQRQGRTRNCVSLHYG